MFCQLGCNCQPMPTALENRCCIKQRGACVTTTGKFARVGDVLDVAGAYRNDLYAYEHRQNKRMFQHTGYRQYVLMTHGVLHAGERKVVPSCAVRQIRQKYPAENGQYTRFHPGRLEKNWETDFCTFKFYLCQFAYDSIILQRKLQQLRGSVVSITSSENSSPLIIQLSLVMNSKRMISWHFKNTITCECVKKTRCW